MVENNAPYIKKAILKGYKSIREGVDIDLLPGMNIIIGPNGSGKSNFLELVEKVVEVNRKEREKYLRTDAHLQIVTNNGIVSQYWKSDINIDNGLLSHFKKQVLKKINFTLPVLLPLLDENLSLKIIITNNNTLYLDSIELGLSLSANYFFEIFEMKEINVKIDSDTISDYIKNRFQTWKSKYLSNLRQYTPIQDFRFNEGFSVKINKDNEVNINYLRLEFLVNDEWLDWQQLSDGTKRLFYVVAEVTAQEDSILLLEEPELGVHPHQLHKLMNFLKEQSAHKQIILTTHSPQVLNILNSDELDRIIVAEMTDKGTKLRHLTEKQIKKAQKYMATELSLGDYWEFSDLEPQNVAL